MEHDTTSPSPEYQALQSGLNAWEIWASLEPPQRLQLILDRFPAEEWFLCDKSGTDNLSTLAHFAQDKAQWGLIKARFKGIGGNTFDLEQAVNAYHAAHNGTGAAGRVKALALPETLTALLAAHIPPPVQLFENLMHEGMLLFGGKSKRGKSWLIFDLAIALAAGRAGFRHFACPAPLPVLYLALEDGRARLQSRARAIQPNLATLDHFHLRYSFPRLDTEGIALLGGEITTHQYGLVIIDVLTKVEPPKAGKGDKSYGDIYEMFAPLQDLRKQHPFCLAMLTHLRKQEAEDVFDALLGSVAYQGAQDVLWVLERKPKDDYAFLHIRDKDAEDQTVALRFDGGHWEYMGEGEEYQMSRDQRRVVTVLAEEKRDMSVQEILKAGSFPDDKYGYLRKLLVMMVKEDLIHRTRHGKYSATIRGVVEMTEERYPGQEEENEEDQRYR